MCMYMIHIRIIAADAAGLQHECVGAYFLYNNIISQFIDNVYK